MSNKNYVCPICNGKLVVKQEHGFNKAQFINPKTGMPEKRVMIEHFGTIETPIFIDCSNINCDFTYSRENGNEFFDNLINSFTNNENFKIIV
jgi:ssDNA-binding Zn-finger/Zn-ribbon topoisomerase 1